MCLLMNIKIGNDNIWIEYYVYRRSGGVERRITDEAQGRVYYIILPSLDSCLESPTVTT